MVEMPEKVAALVKKITELLAKEAVTVVPQRATKQQAIFALLPSSKKKMGMKPILDLRFSTRA
jgi:predicted lipid carrier protein YhbT